MLLAGVIFLNELADGRYVAPTVETVETYARHWLEAIAPASCSAITLERYATRIRAYIIPGLGPTKLQALDGSTIDAFYARLRKSGRRDGKGLSPLSLRDVHSVLGLIIGSAVKAKKLARSPLDDVQTKPKPKRRRIEVLDEADLGALLGHLRGHWLYMPTLLAAYTGLRRGEVLGLRWHDVDFARGTLEVAQAVEEVAGKLSVKKPKTDRSARTIKLPASLLMELERHRKEQLEQRLKVGLGGRSELVFTSPLGNMLKPDSVTGAFAEQVAAAGLKPITFHGLRHTHISMLLKSGVPVHAVAARAGHSRSSITLDVYSHLLGGEDDDAANRADEMLKRLLK